MGIIIADNYGVEKQEINIDVLADFSIGTAATDNDYSMTVSLQDWETLKCTYGYRLYIPGTEYGGLVQDIQADTANEEVTASGYTWRGMLAKKIIEPPAGEAYKTVSGDANSIIRDILSDLFGNLYVVPGKTSEFSIKNYQFARYTDVLSGLEKMLATVNAKLKLSYVSVVAGKGYVDIQAVPRIDYSSQVEYSDDNGITFVTRDMRRGINHLICLGRGELQDRDVVHLYVQEDGSISETKFYTGIDELVATYDYGSAETHEELIKGGTERLQGIKNYQQFDLSIEETVADIGDIVAGRERITGTIVSQAITQKIVDVVNDEISISYKVGGAQNTSSSVGGGIEKTLTFNDIYPINSIYMSTVNTNPAILFGGTWQEWGSGKVPVGVNASETEFNEVEKTGGEKIHQLTEGELPAHRHSIPALSGTAANAGAHSHNILTEFGEGAFNNAINPNDNIYAQVAGANSGSKVPRSGSITEASAHQHGVTTNASNTGYAGSTGAHNNLQPYITCYMWKRTA